MQSAPALFSPARWCLLLSLLLWFGARPGQAAQPYDNCSGAIVIPGTGPFPYLTQEIDMTAETTLNDPPYPNVPGFDTDLTRSIWVKFTPAETGLYTVSSGPDTATQFADTTMVMYTATADCGPFSIYRFNEDSGSLRASISAQLTNNTTYYIVVWVGKVSSADAPTNAVFDLQLRVSKPSVPANDACAAPFDIPSVLVTNFLSPIIDTTLAATTPGIVPPCVTNIGVLPSREVWFRFAPSATGTYIFSTGSDTKTLIDDTAIGLYTLGSGCQAPDQIACNDNGFGRAVLSAPLNAGTTYYIAIWDNSPPVIPGETALQLRVSPSTAPTVDTLPVISVASTGAVLSGTVNANGLLSRYWFEWGPVPSLGSTSTVKFLFAGANTFTTNIAVSGFQPNITYQYQMVATNALGTSRGRLQTFVWNNTPPVLEEPERQGGGGTILRFVGRTNQLYVVQGSTNLVTWEDLGLATELTNQTGGVFQFLHTPQTFSPHRFYKVRLP